jgi:hypothetical protein
MAVGASRSDLGKYPPSYVDSDDVEGTHAKRTYPQCRDSAGELVAAGHGHSCFADLRTYTIAPGDSLVDQLSWTAARGATPLPAGTYSLLAGVMVDGDGLVRSDSHSLRVR